MLAWKSVWNLKKISKKIGYNDKQKKRNERYAAEIFFLIWFIFRILAFGIYKW